MMNASWMILPILSLSLTVLVWRFSPRDRRSRNLLLLGLLTFGAFALAGCGPNWVQTAQQLGVVISGLIPMASSAGAALDPGEASAITNAATVTQSAVQELENAIKSYNSSPSDTTLQEVQSVISSVNSNLSGLETAAQVKDAATQKKIGAIVAAATSTVGVLEASILALHPQTVANAQSGNSNGQ
jgi:hypothetical protein